MKLNTLSMLTILGLFTLASCSKPTASVQTGGAAPSSGDLVLLQVELPADLLIGTIPDNIPVPNLDKAKQSPIEIPKSATVISKGKPVTSSDKEVPLEGELSYLTDGLKDGNEGFSVIIDKGPQWMQIDLGESHLVDAVVLWHYFKNHRVINDLIVQVSEDPEFKTGVTTLYNNDSDNTSGQGIGNDRPYIGNYLGRQVHGNGTKARYIRTWSNGSTDSPMNEFIEVEVWGRPVK